MASAERAGDVEPERLRPPSPTPLEAWAGVECAHVRIGDRWSDQLALTGHSGRVDDIDRLGLLGVTAVRYPFLWGWDHSGGLAMLSKGDDLRAWRWRDTRATRLHQAGLRTIAGLLHHGHGPLPGGMLDEGFVPAFAAYAGEVARRYPWIEDWLPVNEPLTTARFAGAYGHWHPHASDVPTFARLLVAQVLAIRAAMRAIRASVPTARLIVNEDVGRVFSGPEAGDHRDFANERRWLTFDLLLGRVDRWHPMRRFLEADRVLARDLDSLVDEPCPPDVIGVDWYVTSDRFLDVLMDGYPEWSHGGDGRLAFADVELVQVREDVRLAADPAATFEPFNRAIAETWARYGRPIALTEVQLAAEPRDQIAWWGLAWRAAQDAAGRGVAVRGVTAWSAFGAYDWNSLLCRDDGFYEPGAFDARFDPPRRTALGRAIARTAATGRPPARREGWWDCGLAPWPAVEAVEGADDEADEDALAPTGTGRP